VKEVGETRNVANEFHTRRVVAFSETDMAGVVHFAEFFRYMEDAEHELWRSVGWSVVQRQPDGTVLTWPRVHASCDYRSPARFEDVLDIYVSVARSGRRALRYAFRFQLDGRDIATGTIVAVCCVLENAQLRAIDIPEEVLARLAPYRTDLNGATQASEKTNGGKDQAG